MKMYVLFNSVILMITVLACIEKKQSDISFHLAREWYFAPTKTTRTWDNSLEKLAQQDQYAYLLPSGILDKPLESPISYQDIEWKPAQNNHRIEIPFVGNRILLSKGGCRDSNRKGFMDVYHPYEHDGILDKNPIILPKNKAFLLPEKFQSSYEATPDSYHIVARCPHGFGRESDIRSIIEAPLIQ